MCVILINEEMKMILIIMINDSDSNVIDNVLNEIMLFLFNINENENESIVMKINDQY
jgi:hypothetical protein